MSSMVINANHHAVIFTVGELKRWRLAGELCSESISTRHLYSSSKQQADGLEEQHLRVPVWHCTDLLHDRLNWHV